jgi:predicted small lipoprotein YifL
MKRLLVLVAVLVPLSFFLAGCGGSGGPAGKSLSELNAEQKQMQKEMQRKMEEAAKAGKGMMPAEPK